MVPGGQGVFPSLTVDENLRLAGWLDRKDKSAGAAVDRRVLELFPVAASTDAASRPPTCQRRPAADAHPRHGAASQQPRLLMIDELSLGLAPTHRRRAARGGAATRGAGHHGDPRGAVGERRADRRRDRVLHGEGRDPLPRPDQPSCSSDPTCCARCSSKAPGARWSSPSTSPQRRCTSTATYARTVTSAAESAPTARSAIRLSLDGVTKRFGGIAALSRRVVRRATGGEILGFLGPNGAGKTTLFDVLSGFHAARRGRRSMLEGRRRRRSTSRTAAAARPPRARPVVPGRAAVPALTVAETIAVAFERSVDVATRRPRRCTCRRSSTRRPRWRERVEELIELLGLARLPRQVHPRALHRQPARRRPRLRARARPVGAPARRAVVGHRAARGRGARAAAPADPGA